MGHVPRWVTKNGKQSGSKTKIKQARDKILKVYKMMWYTENVKIQKIELP